MAKRTPIDKLQSTISKALESYAGEIDSTLDDAVKKVTKAGVSALRSESRQMFGGSGAYAKGWTSQAETSRLSSQGIIFNTKPGLPHLLEHGHANRGGGRTAGRAHIAPVEETIITQFQAEVEKTI